MSTMTPIIPPVERELLEQELTPERFVKLTKFGKNEIYIFDHHSAPMVMREVGRLRELTFRFSGGGTGKELDIDEFDLMDPPFEQLIVWNPVDKEILGGYRFIHGAKLRPDEHFQVKTPTAELFHFSEKFTREYLPKTIELGRSWVQPAYQPANEPRKGIFSLDNIWNGLGALITRNPDVNYFFGKITMYPTFDRMARDLILYFLKKFFPDPDHLVRPLHPLPLWHEESVLAKKFHASTYDENYRILNQLVRAQGENIPPLVSTYMNLSSTMRTFGTSNNPGFGNVEETGIIIKISDIYDSKKERHLS